MNWHAVCDKWSEQGYDSLTEPEQIWLNTRGLIDAINNGGLVSYFYNPSADNYEDTTFALGELEAYEVLDILESFAALFGEEVPSDIYQRNAIISSWKQNGPESKASENVDSLLSPLLGQLEETLETYLIEQGFDP